jgi:uncharacterized protein (DUF1810 family)
MISATDRHDLERFVAAQQPVYTSVLAELRAGRKTTHWMWFIFPQLKALGRSTMAKHFGIADRAEAAAYLGHAVLGPRLKECAALLLAIDGKTAHAIFGSPDDLKLRSSMTLFDAVAGDGGNVFAQVLGRFYGGAPDEASLGLLSPG